RTGATATSGRQDARLPPVKRFPAPGTLYGNRFADFWKQDLGSGAFHSRHELFGRLVQQGEGTKMAGDDGLKMEEAPAGKRGDSSSHGEAVTHRDNADLRLMQFLDQGHVGKDIRITHVIYCLVLRKVQDRPAGIAKIGVRPAVGLRGRRVERLYESGGEPATIHGTANVSGVDLP